MQILSVSTQSTMTMEQSTKEENSFARLSANVDLLCTSETKVTVSQKLSWLTHRNPQRGERQTDKEYRVGGGSSVRVIYSDAGQIGCNMLIRRKAFWFPIPKKKKKKITCCGKVMQPIWETLRRHHCFPHEALLISDHFTQSVVAIETVKILYKAAWEKAVKHRLIKW